MSERLMWSGVSGVGDLKAGTLVQSLCQSVKLTKWQKKKSDVDATLCKFLFYNY